MFTKQCRWCLEVKSLDSFYKNRRMSDGHLNKCKVCFLRDCSLRRERDIERIREYDRNRPNHKERMAINKKYRHKKSNRKQVAVKKLEWAWRNKDKRHTHSLTATAVRNGVITKRCCEACGALDTEAHHEDYSKPLDVVWLCDKHHKQRHRELNNIKRKKG
jgi:hypothetical protein